MLELPGFDFDSIEAVRAELPASGDIASQLSNTTRVGVESTAATAGDLERIADVPIYASDPLVRRAPSLQKTRDGQAPTARMHPGTLARLGIGESGEVRVRQGGGEAVLKVAADAGVPDGCVRIAAAHPATSGLGSMFGAVVVEAV